MRVAATVVLALTAGCATPAAVPFADSIPPYHEGARLVVVGDLQRTAPILQHGQEQNDAERTLVVNAIACERPDLLAITGDCVFNGGSDGEWSAFDDLVAPLHARGIPAIAAFGNHEYWRGTSLAEGHFFPRFPLDAGHHWFTLAFGPLRIVVLDGNHFQFMGGHWRSQIDWYVKELDSLDRDATARGVIVVLHEPPYSNSDTPGEDGDVQRDVVPPFLSAKKTMAMLSGHVHSYERFVLGNKTFVVSGGGGGPRATLDVGPHRRRPFDQFCGPSLRDFHFTVYTLTRSGVEAEVRAIPKGGTVMRAMDSFSLAWPEGA